MNSLQLKKRAFLAAVSQVKGIKATKLGVFPLSLSGCVDDDSIVDYKILGKSGGVGDLSKNLISYPYYSITKIENGITYTDNGDGSITANGTASGISQFFINLTPAELNLDSSASYFLSGCPAGSERRFRIEFMLSKNNTVIVDKQDYGAGSLLSGFTTDFDKIIVKIYITAGTTVKNIVFKPQLELGETATEYVPYGKYAIPIVTHGKNVFDITKCDTYNAEKGSIRLAPNANRDNAEGRVDTVTDMQVGRPYVITGTSTSSSGYFVYLRGTQKIWRWGQSYTPQEADFNERIYFYKCTGTSDPEITQEVIITNVQIEQGTAATDYEPYHAPITTVITLPEPLGAGDYISHTAQAIIHADGTKTSVSLPKIPTYKGTTILECNTTTAPEGAEITYYTNNEED